MRRPLTLVAYVAVVSVVLVASLARQGAEPLLLAGCAIIVAGVVGLYRGSRLAWILLTVVHAGNVLLSIATTAAWWIVVLAVVQLALLLAPPTRRHVRRESPDAAQRERAPRSRLALRIGAGVLGFVVVSIILGAVLPPRGPVSGDLEAARSDRPGLRVLFIGNRLTSDNDMTETVRRLGEGDRDAAPIFAVRYAERASTLDDALKDDELEGLLDGERWDAVVLQEHSQRAARRAEREQRTLPAAATLQRLASRAGARTVFYVAPGYEDGDPEIPDDSYPAMQARLSSGLAQIASRLSAEQAPVARAWAVGQAARPKIDLWAGDGQRLSDEGSYLAACVLYAVLTNRDPAASDYDAGLDDDEAQRLRHIARAAVAS